MSSNGDRLSLKILRLTIIVLFSILGVMFCLFTFEPSTWEARCVRKALSIYFAEHHEYPEDIETLVEESFLKNGSFKHVSYAPELGYGSYRLSVSPWWGHATLSGPPVSERSHTENLKQLRQILKEYYFAYGHYPKELEEIPKERTHGYWEEIRVRDYAYSASADLAEFTLGGDTFGSPSTWPSEMKLLSTEGKLQYLGMELNLFFGSHERYPENLQEMVAPAGIPAELLRDLIEGEDISYVVSEDGQKAYLNGQRVKRLLCYYKRGW
jgi:hypothetical protein